jgi:AraC family transcriptional regulator
MVFSVGFTRIANSRRLTHHGGSRMSLYDHHGKQKYPSVSLLSSSASLGWSCVAAELRCIPPGELPAIQPTQMEIAIAMRADNVATVSRKGDGVRQETRVEPGVIWLCPAGVGEDEIIVTAPMTEVLHIYLPASRFDQLSDVFGGSQATAKSIRYLAGVHDDLIRQIGVSMLGEMKSESAAGKVLVESLALTLSARLAQTYANDSPPIIDSSYQRHELGDVRIRRVMDYMSTHLEDDIRIEDLAGVACLSPFHFIRMFSNTMGVPPHRYLSRMRLERAKALLAICGATLADIALACRFSSQANFTRAFKRATGMTPGEYRQATR